MNFTHLPKVELHCHLDGIPDPAMLREMQRQGYQLPISPEALEAAYPVTNSAGFWKWFSVAEALEGSLEGYKPILAQHIERLKTQHVVYAEIMIASSEIPRDRSELVGRFRDFRDFVDGLEDDKIQVEFLAIFGRNRPPEFAAELADRILMLHEAGLIVGVGLAGPEVGYPVKPFHRTFARFREAGLGIEIHAGEWAGPEAVWDALEYGFPNRIGHGVAVFQDPRLVGRFQEAQIHIEMCPTSNVKTGSIGRLEEHPVKHAKALGLNFSLNTDDPGAFQCSLASEFQLMTDTFGFQESDFETIRENSLNARFQPKLRAPIAPRAQPV